MYFDLNTNKMYFNGLFVELSSFEICHNYLSSKQHIQFFRHVWALGVVYGGALEGWKKSSHIDNFQKFACIFNTAANIINQKILGSIKKNIQDIILEELNEYKIPKAIKLIPREKKKSTNYLNGIISNPIMGFEQDSYELSEQILELRKKLCSYLKLPNHNINTFRIEYQSDYNILTKYINQRMKNGIVLHNSHIIAHEDLDKFIQLLIYQMSNAASQIAIDKISQTKKLLKNIQSH